MYGFNCEEMRSGLLETGIRSSLLMISNDFEGLVQDKLEKAMDDRYLVEFELKMDIVLDFALSTFTNLESYLDARLESLLAEISSNAIVVNVILIGVLTILMVLFWKVFVVNYESRICKSKLVLNLFPTHLIGENSTIKRFLGRTCKSVVIS